MRKTQVALRVIWLSKQGKAKRNREQSKVARFPIREGREDDEENYETMVSATILGRKRLVQ
jgi:hypothetical protein